MLRAWWHADGSTLVYQMKVSVCIVTYNHAPFIAEALDSVLMQRTNFDYQIVVGEDESSDGTREIVADYAARFPGKIKALFHSRKDVIHYRGRPTGRFNFMQTLKHCTGDYVAMLDGDDFWTDPNKLQQQVDFLDANKDCVICTHDVVKRFLNGKEVLWTNPASSYGFVDLLALKYYPPTCSVVYRNHLIKELPEWFARVMVGDFPLHLLNARFGRIAHLPNVMATYRHHPGGLWSGWGENGRKDYSRRIAWNEGMVEMYQIFAETFAREHRRTITRRMAQFYYENAWLYYNCYDLVATRKCVVEALKLGPFCTGLQPSHTLRLWAAALCPWMYRRYTRAKHLLRGTAPASSDT